MRCDRQTINNSEHSDYGPHNTAACQVCSCHYGTVRLQVAGGGDGLQIWGWLQTRDSPSDWGVEWGEGRITTLYRKKQHVTVCYRHGRILSDDLHNA